MALWMAAGVLFAAYGCGSTSTANLVGPSEVRCTITLTGGATPIDSQGGTGSLVVATARECTWSARSEVDWISITSGGNGQGDGRIEYSVASNPVPAMRRGTVMVGDTRTEIVQSGAPCEATLSPTTETVGVDGGEVTVAVTTIPGCVWTATSHAPWVAVTSGGGDGSGTVALTIAANAGPERTGTVTIAGRTFSVVQAAACHTYTLSSTVQMAPFDGGTFTVQVVTQPWCEWTATSHASWIAIASGNQATGTGSLSLVVAANAGAPRTGTATIAGQTYTVTQAAACETYSLDATSRTVPPQGATFAVQVSTPAWCEWTAASNDSWIAIASAAHVTGSGTLSLVVAANTGPPRTGTATIAGQVFTVVQEAACNDFGLNSTSQSVPFQGGSFTILVIAQPWCAWTAASNDPWMTITSGDSGLGSGAVSISVASNPGAPRSGTATIAGLTYTVTQAADCSLFSLGTSSQTVPSQGGTATVQVTALPWCTWTAASSDPWIAVTGGASGSGNGAVTLTIAPNTGAPRTGTATIAGHTFSVMQEGFCSFSLSRTSQLVSFLGGTFTVNVIAQPWCEWTATSNNTWIQITGGDRGTGNGVVTFRVDSSLLVSRTGTMTIAGQTFTVTQSLLADNER
jgi:hypothetical protein